MSLLDSVKNTEVSEPEVKKPHNNSEYQKKQREKSRASGQLVAKFIKDKKIEVPADVQAALDFLSREPKAGGSTFGKPVFYKLFGDTPKIGDKITALKVFETTGKGFAEMKSLMRKWTEKQGITVEYDDKTKAYVIKSGTITPYVA